MHGSVSIRRSSPRVIGAIEGGIVAQGSGQAVRCQHRQRGALDG